MRPYFTLCVKQDGTWWPQFGDYNRKDVIAESRDSYGDEKGRNKFIVKTENASQAAIVEALHWLNRHGVK